MRERERGEEGEGDSITIKIKYNSLVNTFVRIIFLILKIY